CGYFSYQAALTGKMTLMNRFFNFFRRPWNKTSNRKATRPRSKRPALSVQVLEDRTMPASGLLSSLVQPGLSILQDNSVSAVYTSTGAAHPANTPIVAGDIIAGVLRITQSNAGGSPTLNGNQQLVVLYSAQIATQTTFAGAFTEQTLRPTPAGTG